MNGADLPNRARPFGLSTVQGRTEAQTACPVFSCKGPEEKQPTGGSHSDKASGHAPSLIRPRLAHARTRHQWPWEVTYTGTGP